MTNMLMAVAGRAFKSLKSRLYFTTQNLDVFIHPMAKINVAAEFIPDIEPTNSDVHIADRLLRAYSRARCDLQTQAPSVGADVWSDIASHHQASFFDVLHAENPELLAQFLCNMSRNSATHGIVQGALEYERLKRSSTYRRYIARMAKDKLIALAEAVGAIPCENPEQGSWGDSVWISEMDLALSIESVLQIKIAPPNIDGGLFKIGRGEYQFGERDCNAIYTAWLLKSAISREPLAEASICEIGGGVGRVAYWAKRFGIGNYTIIDLPHINVLQGFYLLKSLQNVPLQLYGEDPLSEPCIKIFPNHSLPKILDEKYGLILNQDSFPEIDKDAVINYLDWIRMSAKSFISINHESKPSSTVEGKLQLSIPELVSRVGGYERKLRFPYWLRKGYVYEHYDLLD